MKIEKKHFNEIIKTTAKSIVGRSCARVEEVFNSPTGLNDTQKEDLIKSALRNLIPEIMRDMKFQIECYNKGREVHTIKFQKDSPTD